MDCANCGLVRFEVRFLSCEEIATLSGLGVIHRGHDVLEFADNLVCAPYQSLVVDQPACGAIRDQRVDEQNRQHQPGACHNLFFDCPSQFQTHIQTTLVSLGEQ